MIQVRRESSLIHPFQSKLSPKHAVPETTADAKPAFIISVMVIHVVLLEVVVIGREAAKLSATGKRGYIEGLLLLVM